MPLDLNRFTWTCLCLRTDFSSSVAWKLCSRGGDGAGHPVWGTGMGVGELVSACVSSHIERNHRLHIAELEALPADQWERMGQHEEQGNISIGSHTLHIVSHDMIHAAQIARQLHGVTAFTS